MSYVLRIGWLLPNNQEFCPISVSQASASQSTPSHPLGATEYKQTSSQSKITSGLQFLKFSHFSMLEEGIAVRKLRASAALSDGFSLRRPHHKLSESDRVAPRYVLLKSQIPGRHMSQWLHPAWVFSTSFLSECGPYGPFFVRHVPTDRKPPFCFCRDKH